MSVYTTVEQALLEQFLKRYALGKPVSLEPVAAGITNTNYYLDTTSGNYVLTLYEHHSDDELEYLLGLQQHLATAGVACPAPLADRRGDLYSSLKPRPAAIIHRLPGAVKTVPETAHCASIGTELARFHLAGQDYPRQRPNPRGFEWLAAAADMLDAYLDDDDRRMFESTMHDYRVVEAKTLPRGAIHADLFHDNALFSGDELSGIIDFDYACEDYLIFDIAVLLNDWCISKRGDFKSDLVSVVLQAYQRQRKLNRDEIIVLPVMLRLAALRFWFSRLNDIAFPPSGELTFTKNPDYFRAMLAKHSAATAQLEDLFFPHYMG